MAFGGIPMANFTDIRLITGPGVLRKPSDFPNEAQERTYITGHWLRGMNGVDHLQGGTRPEDYIMKDDGSTASNNLPSAMRSTNDPQVMAQISTEWRLTEDSKAPNLIMRALNMTGGGDVRSQYMQYKSEDAKQDRRLATSYCNKFEADWFAQPNATTQTGTAGAVDPTPFWTYVNEYGATAGSPFDATDSRFPRGTGLPNGFTTIDGQNPTTEKWWRPWQLDYTYVPATTTVNPGASDWIVQMSKAITLTTYAPLPWKAGEATTNMPLNDPDYIIPVSTNGQAYVQAMVGLSSNYFRSSPNDLYYPNFHFAGIPFLPCSVMDTVRVYPDVTVNVAPLVGAGGTETTAVTGGRGPRFPIISRKHISWVMHSTFNFYQWPTRSPSRQWDVEISPISTLHNRLCRSRRKMAILYPSANITGFGG